MLHLRVDRGAVRYRKGDLEASPVRRKEASSVFSELPKGEWATAHSTER